MDNKGSCSKGYMFAVVLGAISGGAIVALATKAVPKVMSGIMRNMMTHMGERGCDPAKI